MEDILKKLSDHARFRVEEAKKTSPLPVVRAVAETMPKGWFSFENALKKPEMSFICEVKKASPSKGIIAEDFPYLQIAREYEDAGADAISVLTEPKWFLGSDEYLKEISENVTIPILRKDFTVDPYMIYEAKTLGASAILLIVSILDPIELIEYMDIAESLGLSCLVEVHDVYEIDSALKAGARVVGVNNRNLKDFSVDVNNANSLRGLVPESCIFVAESGIAGPEEAAAAKRAKADACLVGESLMRAKNKAVFLKSLREG